jgi:hypothetical protein
VCSLDYRYYVTEIVEKGVFKPVFFEKADEGGVGARGTVSLESVYELVLYFIVNNN